MQISPLTAPNIPASIRSSDVLPQPLAPRTTRVSPERNRTSTLRKTSRPPLTQATLWSFISSVLPKENNWTLVLSPS